MIEVGPAGARCAMGWSRLVGWHDVDQPTAGAKLRQFSLPRFEGQTQHIEVEPLDRRRIRCAQYDVSGFALSR